MSLDDIVRERVRAELRAALPALLDELVGSPKGEYLDTAAAAEFIGLSIQYLECGRSKGRNPNVPPHIKVGRRVLYKRSDLVAFMEHRREREVLR
ncbi:MAG: helix-turn-helix domain-containing protein [Hyphomonadaceae bacterium]|nr:helix-turn-helix domain-containing protein [Hyphomonadaceae bacterium]